MGYIINYVLIFLVNISDNDKKYECPQSVIKEGVFCSSISCGLVLEADNIKDDALGHHVTDPYGQSISEPNHLPKKSEGLICIKDYFIAEKCTECKYKQFLNAGRCCNGKGEELKKLSSYAVLLDKCTACDATAFQNKSIDHIKAKHNLFVCPKCTKQFEKSRNCCGKPCQSLTVEPEIIKICSKSGTYPHCTTVPPNLTGVITKIKIYEGQETDYGHLGAITIENAPGKCYPITVIVTENTKFTRPAHPCRTHHGSTTIELKELYNDARISVWFDESKKTKSNSTATIALEVSIWEECD